MVKKIQSVSKKDLEQLLSKQTDVILTAVDERLGSAKSELKSDISDLRVEIVNLEVRFNKKLEAMEERWNKKFDKLTTTLDKFLKRMTDMKDEFTMMRADLDRVKKVIREKLGVDFT